jgi:hypothetical protein
MNPASQCAQTGCAAEERKCCRSALGDSNERAHGPQEVIAWRGDGASGAAERVESGGEEVYYCLCLMLPRDARVRKEGERARCARQPRASTNVAIGAYATPY